VAFGDPYLSAALLNVWNYTAGGEAIAGRTVETWFNRRLVTLGADWTPDRGKHRIARSGTRNHGVIP